MARSRARSERSELKNISYEIFIGALSVLSIANLVLMAVMHGSEALQLILWVMNALFSVIFLGDFIYRMATAPSASHYFFRGFGWADLLASLWFPQLKVLRVFRLWRVVRLMRGVGPRNLWNTVIHDRANSALMTLLLMGILVLEFGSIAILFIEEDADGANITSASDALWYTLVTISTVGYGDQYPVTNAGRLIGTLIIVVGVGIFGTFTGYLANVFLGPSRGAEAEEHDEGEKDAAAAAATAAPALPPVTAEHTATGLAAGSVSGAVTAGAASAAGGTAGSVDAGRAVDAAPSFALASTAQLLLLLEESERINAELRALIGSASPRAATSED
ncbi:ion transporter [Microbacterium sp. BK668]|uniref:ion transporter n=1 Tax=Microbacterium sp. BK668 TaxID=2512118 RepID=UPI00105FDE48|nr:ion transporter [Microbacterium sp. BK668]TDN88556.1 ion channel [Microbacterium sp. BK668]